VWTLDHDAVAAAVSVEDVEPARWDRELNELLLQVGRRCVRRETRRHLGTDAVPIRELVRVAGRRWAIEESFQAGKNLAGLDEHQVRRWTSWRRWTVLAMLAHALLAVTPHATEPATPPTATPRRPS
jgi:SRSO17 transposase